MRHWVDTVANQSNVLVPNALVTVFLTGTQTLASLFSDNGITAKANPVSTNSLGVFDFFVADGVYDLQVTGPNISTTTQTKIEIADLGSASAGDEVWNSEQLNVVGAFTAGSITATGLTPGNCVQTTTGGLLTTAGAPCGTSSGTVTTTGSPVAGNLAAFSSTLSLTGANLTGDVTTSGGTATTLSSALAGNYTFSGNSTHTGTETFTGAINPTIINAVRYLSPSNAQGWAGSTADAWLASAIASLPIVNGYHTGKIQLAAGAYTFAGTVTINSPAVILEGAGSSATVITCTANADCINTQLAVTDISPGFKMGGMSILGTGSTNANAVGVHAGDMVGGMFYDLQIDNFLGANSACFWADNKTFWWERNYLSNVELGVHGPPSSQNGCTKAYRQTVNGGTGSFESNIFEGLHLSVVNNTTGISMESGACYSCVFAGNANAGNNTTVFSIPSTSGTTPVHMNLVVDVGTSTGVTLWSLPAGATFDYSGTVTVLSASSPPTNNIVGGLRYHWAEAFGNPIAYGAAAGSIAPNGVGTTLSTSTGFGTNIGAYLQRDEGSANGFLTGLGANLFFDPVAGKWTLNSDGVNNAGSGIFGSNGAGGILNFFVVPNSATPAVGQTIAQASLLANNLKATLDSTGNFTPSKLSSLSIPTASGNATLTQTIASGTAAMTTALIAAGSCGTTVSVGASGVATTDSIVWSFNAQPAGSNTGLVAWPTANTVNFAYCPGTAETPAAATVNWRVVR